MATMATLPSPTFDPHVFRSVMGRFTTGVTVISTATEDGVHGMTANAFMSVSIDPPLVMVSIGKSAKMRNLLAATGTYGVSFLAANQEPHSRHFSGRPQLDLDLDFDVVAGVPLLKGALGRIAARIEAEYDAGDHTLFAGRVLHIDSMTGEPLVFYSGTYRQLHHASHQYPYSDSWSGFSLEPSGYATIPF